MKKRVFSMMLAAVVLLTSVDITVFAQQMIEEEVDAINEEVQVTAEPTTPKDGIMDEEISDVAETPAGISTGETEVKSEKEPVNTPLGEISDIVITITPEMKKTTMVMSTEGVIIEEEPKLSLMEGEETPTPSITPLIDTDVDEDVILATEITASGKCGDNLTWTLKYGTLMISGTGDMWDYSSSSLVPWKEYYKEDITALKLENGITHIGNYAFYNEYNNFTGSLIIPESVTSVGNSAFGRCSGFTGDLIIPERVTDIGSNAFSGCRGFSGNLIISENVTSIGYRAFYGCDGFTGNLIIPESVTSIGSEAFESCSGFTGDLIIPGSITSIESQVFNGCSGFNGNLIISEGVIDISNYAFQDCSGFTGNLIIPDSVISIADYAFRRCSGFTGNLIIPGSVTSIGSNAFQDCSGFTGDLIISEGVTSIGGNAFSGCSGFTGNLTIPESVTNIGSSAFIDCKGFTGSLNIPEGMVNINGNTFSGCSGFTGNLIIPSSVTSITWYAFWNCSNLDNIVFQGNAPSIEHTVFQNVVARAYYPSWKSGWDDIIGNNYGGTLTWIPYEVDTAPWEMNSSENAPNIWFIFETDRDIEYTEEKGYNNTEFNINLAALCMIPIDNSNPTYENVMVTVELPEGLSFSPNIVQRIWENNLGTMSLSGIKRQDLSIPVYLNNNYFTGNFEINVSVTADGYSDAQDNTYTIDVKETPNYDLYDIQVYSEFPNCIFGVEQSMILIPAMIKDGEALKGEEGWTFTVEDNEVAEISTYNETTYGPAATIKGKGIGTTKLNILHISTGRSVDLIINVVDTTDFFNVTQLEKIENDCGIYNAGVYMESFVATRDGAGYAVTFDAYNGLQHYAAVEVYNKEGNLIDIQKINKFDRYQTGFKDVLVSLNNLICSSFNGTLQSYKNEMYSEKTSIEVWVPDNGYIWISNNMSQSIGAYIYNTVDLTFWASTVGKDIDKLIKSDAEKDAIIESASQSVAKQYLETVKSVVIMDATKEKFQNKLYESMTKDITTDLAVGVAEAIANDSYAFYQEWDIDLWNEFTKSAVNYGDSVLVEAFKKNGGPAGIALSEIFKVNSYLNRFMQLVDIQKTKDIKEVKIYIDVDNDKLVSNDVIIENEQGTPITNNKLVVTDVSTDKNSQYIIKNLQNASQIKILDITMYRDNEVVQPDGKIRIRIPVPALYNKDKCVVYRVEEDSSFTDMKAYYESGYMVFETTHLSKYVLAEESENKGNQPSVIPTAKPSATPTSMPSNSWPFIDVAVKSGNWKYENIKFVYENGVMTGVKANQFQPDAPLTRAMFASVIYRLAGSPDITYKNVFSDVPAGKWYSNAIIWAYEKGIVAGLGNGRYGTNDNITREQLARMLMEFAKVQGYNTSDSADFSKFADASEVSRWATDNMRWAVGAGIISGSTKDGSYYMNPKGQATRAECAVMLTKFIQKY